MLRIRGCLRRKVLQCGRRVHQGPLQESHQPQLPVTVALGLQAVSWAVDLTVPLGRSMASRRQSWLNRLPSG
jgi:ABC-type dipeptide/oligopeptide/nickel transport system permease component